MATYVDLNTIHVPATGAAAPAGWGLQVRENFQALKDPARARVGCESQSIPHAVITPASFTIENYDYGAPGAGLWTSASPTRLTAAMQGIYAISGGWAWAVGAANTRRLAVLRVNGGFDVCRSEAAEAGPGLSHSLATDYVFAAGDYLELVLFQNSGGALSSLTGSNFNYMTMRYVGIA